jgi:hypothetical protein
MLELIQGLVPIINALVTLIKLILEIVALLRPTCKKSKKKTLEQL